MKTPGLFGWVKSWVSALMVALAAILLAVAQRLDEGPVIFFMRQLVAEAVKGLEAEADKGAPGVWLVPSEGQPVRVVGRAGAATSGSTYGPHASAGTQAKGDGE